MNISLSIQYPNVFQCTNCGNEINLNEEPVSCKACGTVVETQYGSLNFCPEIPVSSVKEQPGTGQRAMENFKTVWAYEKIYRRFFVAVLGNTLFSKFKATDEDKYLLEHAEATEDGLMMDLACGAGRWTKILCEKTSPKRVIGVDLSFAMLELASNALPDTSFIRGNALKLPFKDSSLGGVNCSNALQLIPNPEQAITEIGRCMQPGGTFTCFTYRKSKSPYRVVQRALEWFTKVTAFDEEELRIWLDNAGMDIVDIQGPKMILFFTAKRR